jgi:hypothetical protein
MKRKKLLLPNATLIQPETERMARAFYTLSITRWCCPNVEPGRSSQVVRPATVLILLLLTAEVRSETVDVEYRGPVCTENLSSGVVVVKSAKDGV